MSELIELIKAMGFWGWMAVIACTAIVSWAVVEIKGIQHKSKQNRGRIEP